MNIDAITPPSATNTWQTPPSMPVEALALCNIMKPLQEIQQIGSVKPLSSSNFNETIAKGVTLVDFYATWCGPCRRLAPVLEGLAAGMDNATIGKVDVDKEPGLASKYGINCYPTMVLFKDGEEVGRLIGTHSAEQIQAFINQA